MGRVSFRPDEGKSCARVFGGASGREPRGFGRIAILGLILLAFCGALAAAELEQGWANPPRDARLRAYWWWLNGCVTKEAITRDLEEMKAKGFGGALICDADGSNEDGNERAPHGPTFFSSAWRELYKHSLREADRLGLEMSLNIQSGWNLGGPMVTADDAAKKIAWSETRLSGPAEIEQKLPEPASRDGYYRDAFVVAYRLKPAEAKQSASGGQLAKRRTLQNWEQKAGHNPLDSSAPDTSLLFEDVAAEAGEEDARAADVLDLTAKMDKDGTLRWNAPAGAWQVFRFGCTIGDNSYVQTCSEGWKGFALDVLDAGAFGRYWDAVVEPLIADAGALAGTTLKYLHTDSWECEPMNWTPALREEFQKRRGYDLLPWLPVLAGRIVESRDASNRFLHDFRKTLGDLAIDNHYQPFRAAARKHGLLIHPESGGPHAVPIDAQRCLGFNDVPMGEFWAWSWRHRIGDQNRFFVKQPASAAHTYGRKLVAAEGFTTIGPHWQETLWDNLKPSFDKACCEGLNLLVWHAFVCSPAEQGLPGLQYFAGTHLNPNVTWWTKSAPFFSYVNRCQFMLQRGLFVADAAYYYGDHVPNFAQHKSTDPARVLPGYDYDVITEEALLTRASVKDGRIVLPDGMSYRVLVLRDQKAISLPVLRKVKELVAAGAMVIGPKPTGAVSQRDSDTEVKQIAEALWNKGRVIADQTARDVLLANGVKPDFEVGVPALAVEPTAGQPKGWTPTNPPDIDYIHRRDGRADIYFVANRTNRATSVIVTFRVAGKAPELWDAVSGERRFATAYTEADGRTTLPLEFPPCGSWFVVFREPAAGHPATAKSNAAKFQTVQELAAPWTAHFPIGTSAPERNDREMRLSSTRSIVFDKLTSWTEHGNPGIKFYSGTASYTKRFDWDPAKIRNPKSKIFLDLGDLRELAEVRLNGRSLGIVWTPPFRVEITEVLKPAGNVLQVEVVNFWPNRIIGDDALPPAKRFTKTNIRKLTQDTPLMPSGLFGPVTLQTSDAIPVVTKPKRK